MSYDFQLRVYYEDTDLAGIVYYANYLKFIERARSEWVRSLGIDQAALKSDQDLVFVVRRVEADYLAPALYDDVLLVRTIPVKITGVRLEVEQTVLRSETMLFRSTVTIAMLTSEGKPSRFPADIRTKLMAGSP
ncbi:tol-pal system-associated acyl-CoA thioesterase [Aestuariibius insulae]|uniref:tol-pal system-associated acyl-CoA thioesterase n=1 Tax=Aestuariibius insulae TaxID=2058287 RepID=UPI00345F1106